MSASDVFKLAHPHIPAFSSPDVIPTDAKTAQALQQPLADRLALAEALLCSLPAPHLHNLISRIDQLTRVDFISALPEELALSVLLYLEPKDLARAAQVSTVWKFRCLEDQQLWRRLYLRAGYSYNAQAIEAWQRQTSPLESSLDQGVELDSSQSEGSKEEDSDEGLGIESSSMEVDETNGCQRTVSEWKDSGVVASPRHGQPSRQSTPSSRPNKKIKYDLSPLRFTDDPTWKLESASDATLNNAVDLLRISSVHYDRSNRPRVNFRHLYRLQRQATANLLAGSFTIAELSSPHKCTHVSRIPSYRVNDFSISQNDSHRERGEENHSYALQFDGIRLIVGNRDSVVRQYSLATGKVVKQFLGHKRSILSLQYEDHQVHDSRFADRPPILVTGSSDNTCRIWNLDTAECMSILDKHSDSVLNVHFDSKHNLLVTASKDRNVIVWKLFPKPAFKFLLAGHRGSVNAVRIHGETIVSASGDRDLRLWDASNGQCLQVLSGHNGGIASLFFDGNTIVSGSSDSTARIWNTAGQCLRVLPSAFDQLPRAGDIPPYVTRNVTSLGGIQGAARMANGYENLVRAMDANDRFIITGSYDRSIRVYSKDTGHLRMHVIGAQPTRIFGLHFSGGKLISCSEDGQVRIFNFLPDEDVSFLV